jgi:hypothetical protein
MAQQPKQEQVNKPISRPRFDLSNNTSNASGAASQNTRNSQPENSQPLYMYFEIIWAWIADQHIILHDCRDPAICELPLDYDQESAASNTQMDGERLRRRSRESTEAPALDQILSLEQSLNLPAVSLARQIHSKHQGRQDVVSLFVQPLI